MLMDFTVRVCIGTITISLYFCAKYIRQLCYIMHEIDKDIAELATEISSLRRALKEKKD